MDVHAQLSDIRGEIYIFSEAFRTSYTINIVTLTFVWVLKWLATPFLLPINYYLT